MKTGRMLRIVLLVFPTLSGMDLSNPPGNKDILVRFSVPVKEPQLPVFKESPAILFSRALSEDSLMRSVEYVESYEALEHQVKAYDQTRQSIQSNMFTVWKERLGHEKMVAKFNDLTLALDKTDKAYDVFVRENNENINMRVSKKIEELSSFIAKQLGCSLVVNLDSVVYRDSSYDIKKYDITELTLALLNWRYIHSKHQ